MFRLLLIFCLFSFFTIFATEYEYPTLMNPDGTIQSRDYNKEQRITFESIKKDVTYFQTEIGKILPYLIRNGKVKNNSYTKEVRNFIETQPGRRNQHFVSETFVLNVNNGKLNSISFLRRRTRLNPKMETETIIRTISNEVTNEELSSVKLQIDTHTNYTDPKMPIKKIIPMTFIPSPMDRIKLLRVYRTKLAEALHELDRIVDRKELNEKVEISNSLNEVDVE